MCVAPSDHLEMSNDETAGIIVMMVETWSYMKGLCVFARTPSSVFIWCSFEVRRAMRIINKVCLYVFVASLTIQASAEQIITLAPNACVTYKKKGEERGKGGGCVLDAIYLSWVSCTFRPVNYCLPSRVEHIWCRT